MVPSFVLLTRLRDFLKVLPTITVNKQFLKPGLTKETDIDMFSNLSNNFIWQPFEWFVYV